MLNSALCLIINKIQSLEELLPDEERLSEPIPMPLLIYKKKLYKSEIDVSKKSVDTLEKERILLKNGIPITSRSTIWKRSIGNVLGISKFDYQSYLQLLKIREQEKNLNSLKMKKLIELDLPRTFPNLFGDSDFDRDYLKKIGTILEAYFFSSFIVCF